MGLLKPRPALAFGHMEVRVDTDAPDVAEQVVRVSDGLAVCKIYTDVISSSRPTSITSAKAARHPALAHGEMVESFLLDIYLLNTVVLQ
jgi:hypothetical protein